MLATELKLFEPKFLLPTTEDIPGLLSDKRLDGLLEVVVSDVF